MTVKDTYETGGMRTTAGAPELAEHVPATDAVAVERLRAAGAIVFGKTNTPTYAADAQTHNPVFGMTKNPWDASRTPGGSSGGAAAATSAGFTALELGSDIGGSIRAPAHCCGIYGLKPTHGLIPLRGHIPGPPGTLAEPDLAVAGPLARDARDLALALEVMAGPLPDRARAWRLALPPPRRKALHEYRVAAWLDDPACPVDEPVRQRLEGAVEALRSAGVKVDDRARPGIDFARAYRCYLRLLWPIMTAGWSSDQFEKMIAKAEAFPEGADDDFVRFARGATARARDLVFANEERERYRVRWDELFASYDVLLCPIVTTTAIPHTLGGDYFNRRITVNGKPREYLELIAWAGVIGMALLPATVAPVGRAADGLPVGVQIVGPYLEDLTTIDFAARLAEVTGGAERPPGF
jgi:amidase